MSTGASNKRNTRRKIENGLRRFNFVCGISACIVLLHLQSLAQLPLNSTHTVVAISYIEHYGLEKLVVKLDNGIYQAGDNLEQQKEQLRNGSKIVINKVRVNNSTKRNFAICKVVQKGDWTGVLDYGKVSLLPVSSKRSVVKVFGCQICGTQGTKTQAPANGGWNGLQSQAIETEQQCRTCAIS